MGLMKLSDSQFIPFNLNPLIVLETSLQFYYSY